MTTLVLPRFVSLVSTRLEACAEASRQAGIVWVTMSHEYGDHQPWIPLMNSIRQSLTTLSDPYEKDLNLI